MAGKQRADYLFLNGRVLTLDKKSTTAQAAAVRGDRILTVGRTASLKKLAGPRTEVLDLRGKILLPGFVDTHAHMDREGLKHLYPSLAGARSIADIQGVIRREVRRSKPGEWIVTMPIGEPPYYFDPLNTIQEGRPPRREELDAVAPENPVYIRGIWGYWGRPPIISAANSLALRLAGITRTTRAPHRRIQIEKDPRTGEPTGVFREMNYIPTLEFTLLKVAPRFTAIDRVRALRRSMQVYNAYGITSAYEGHGVAPEVIAAYREVWTRREMTVRVYLVLSPTWGSVSEAERVMADWAAFGGRGFGDEWLKIGGVFLEYGGNRQMAKTLEREVPYTGWAGFFYKAHTPGEFRRLAGLAGRHHLRVHTIASYDLEGPLQALEDLAQEIPLKDLRPVFVHVLFATPDQIRRMRRLDIRATTIPLNLLWKRGVFLLDDLRSAARAVPLRSFLRAGHPCALSTDNVPPNPMHILWAAEARKERTTGQVLGARECVPREDLLRAFTSHGAYLSFEENQKGSLEPGKLADLVILSEDPLSIPIDGLRDIEVLLTMVGGKIVYQRRETFPAEI
ncbi:MAG: amidohydrolase [Nitrospinota bacterium]